MRANEPKKSRGKLNAIDWILILFVCAAVALGSLFVYRRHRAAIPRDTVQYTVIVAGVDSNLLDDGELWQDLIPKGCRVTSASGTADLGRVTAVRTTEHLVPAVKNGKVVFLPQPRRMDLYVTIRGGATVQAGDGVRVSGIRIAAGGKGDFCFGEYLMEGTVISVKVEDAS